MHQKPYRIFDPKNLAINLFVLLFNVMEITFFAIIIWIIAILIISLDIVLLFGSKNLSSRIFVLLSFLTAVWVISQGFLISSNMAIFTEWLIKLQYLLGISIALGFYQFSKIYPHDKKPSKAQVISSFIVILVFAYLYFFTELLISGVHKIISQGHWSWQFGQLHLIFDFLFYFLWIMALKNIYTTYKSSSGELKMNLKNMYYALLLGIIPPSVANIFLPSFGEYRLNWLGPITGSVWIFIIAYSIMKYRQMNTKTVFTEILAIGMTELFFINIFISVSSNIWLRIAIFCIFITFAIYLVKTSVSESHQKDLLKSLNDTLEQKVFEQTQEIRKAYELEKKARRELEKLNETKDQFIMITQHHLRAPVTNIQTELKTIALETESKATNPLIRSIESIKSSTTRLARTVDDFLNITTLKVGSKILNTSNQSMLPILEDILKELAINIDRMNVVVNYEKDIRYWPDIKIDGAKIREAFHIIIENAVKYNINGGTINIETKNEYDEFEITVKNTGIGITYDEKNKLFSKLFFRGERAKTSNPIGMGIGLSVARAVIRAHHGDITIQSDGENCGATVIVRLPVDFIRQINLTV
jgi:signal transduction histidine kinase